MNFCKNCAIDQYCKGLSAPLFTDAELKRERFQQDFRAFLVGYTFKNNLLPSEWHEHLIGLYRDYLGWIRGEDGKAVFLHINCFEIEHIREWFRDFIQLVPHGAQPRLRGESKERVRVLATIMRAYYPVEASMWGVRPANDNDPLISP